MRRIVANLDFEEELRAAAVPGAPPYRPLSAAARRRAAAAGSRLSALARPGDRLWLPALPEATSGAARAGDIIHETGPLGALPPADELLAWGEGPSIAALRRARPGAGARPASSDDGSAGGAGAELWRLAPSPPEVVARVAHRGFGFALARERGWTLPGAFRAAAVGAVEAGLSPDCFEGGWVVKGAFSAAGRERLFLPDAGALRQPEVRRRLERLLERHGSVVVEPWVERSADFGCAGWVSPAGTRLLAIHGQEVDRRGAFRGIVPLPSDFLPLHAVERDLLEAAFDAAADALAAAGYTGAFGIDAFRWRRPGGEKAFHPLVEINPRLTFGLVAWAERARHAT